MINILEKLVGKDVTIYASEYAFSGKLTKVDTDEYVATIIEPASYAHTGEYKTVIRIGAIDAVRRDK